MVSTEPAAGHRLASRIFPGMSEDQALRFDDFAKYTLLGRLSAICVSRRNPPHSARSQIHLAGKRRIVPRAPPMLYMRRTRPHLKEEFPRCIENAGDGEFMPFGQAFALGPLAHFFALF
jgi:hypothetical protein